MPYALTRSHVRVGEASTSEAVDTSILTGLDPRVFYSVIVDAISQDALPMLTGPGKSVYIHVHSIQFHAFIMQILGTIDVIVIRIHGCLCAESINGVPAWAAQANKIDFCNQPPVPLKLPSEDPVWLIKLFICNTYNLTMQGYHLYSYSYFHCTTTDNVLYIPFLLCHLPSVTCFRKNKIINSCTHNNKLSTPWLLQSVPHCC